MRGIFTMVNPDQIAVRLTLDMTLGEAKSVRDYIQKAAEAEPYSVVEFRRQLTSIIDQGERHFTPAVRHTERPDG